MKVAIVTGAGSGIGRAVAVALLNDQYNVVLAGRRAENLNETVDAALSHGKDALAVPTDVTDVESVRSLFDKTRSDFGRLDLLFNNAGIGAPAINLEELTSDQWRAVVDVNLTGAFLCTQQAFRLMKSQSPVGGPNHQQRFHLCNGAEAQFRTLHGDQACHYRVDQIDCSGWPEVQHRLRADRYREC